jgi:hypothetical protein
LGLASISYDPVATLADFSARRGITFPLLSDPGSDTIKRYGILNTTIDARNPLYGYPFPGTFIVDGRGVVTSRYFAEAYQERETVSSILVRLGAISVEPKPGLIVRSVQYPKSEDFFLRPLREHVPVYQHPLRIVQDVMLDPSKEGTAALKDVARLAMTGRFDYQASDDKVCFTPQSMPLSWTIGVKELDRERPKQR